MGVGELADGLAPKDLNSLGPYELGIELNKIEQDMAAFTDTAVQAVRDIAKAEATVLHEPTNIEAKVEVKIQKATLKAAELQLRSLRTRQSRIQTILRAIPS